MTNKKCPIDLNLFAFKFPITAIVSILHRLSGALVFLFIPLLLWILAASLSSPADFDDLQITLSNPLLKLMLWIFLTALFYHLFAGVRHLVMDIGLGEKLKAARQSSWVVIVLSVIFSLLIGVWLW